MSATTPTKLAAFILDLWDEAVRMRLSGVSREEIQRGLAPTVIQGARERGLITADRDLPPWFLKHCGACQDTGWELTTRVHRGDVIEAYRRCTCRPAGISTRQDSHAVAAKVASGWKQVGRR